MPNDNNADKDREKAIEEALDRWQRCYENGEDHTARKLYPDWPEEWLKVLDQRIAARREFLQEIDSYFEEDDTPERSALGFRSEDKVPDTDFILKELIGSGGFGEVWTARSEYATNDLVVLKFCLSGVDTTTLKNELNLLDRIPKECREGFVQIRTSLIDHSPPFVVYEYVEGGNLYDYLEKRFRDKKGPYSPSEAAEIMLEILRPMAIAHKQTPPIVHRDLKPQNILVARSDCFPPKLKIADLGIGGLSVRASIATSKVGRRFDRNIIGWTHAYASQEQMDNEDRKPNPSDDVHALGVIWYELLSGKQFRGRPSGIGWRKRLAERGMTPKQLELMQSCCDEEENRPKDAVAMEEMIRNIMPSLGVEVKKDIDTISRLRKEGKDWRAYVTDAFGQRSKTWMKASDQGIEEAIWLVGLCCEMGLWDDSDLNSYVEAERRYSDAARRGFGEAAYSLACYYRLGIGWLPKDEEKAIHWLEEAATNGQADALYELGLQHLKSRDKWERLVGITWLYTAARQGHTDAQFWYVRQEWPYPINGVTDFNSECGQLMLAIGHHVTDEECLKWLEAAAQRGHVDAQYLLGVIHERGFRRSPIVADVSQAIIWYRKAADKGHLESQFRLSQCLLSILLAHISVRVKKFSGLDLTNKNVKENMTDVLWDVLWDEACTCPELVVLRNEVFKWWMLAAERGLADAQFELARAYLDDVEQWKRKYLPYIAPKEVIYLLCKAVAQGHSRAVAYLLNPMSSAVTFCILPQVSNFPNVLSSLEFAAEKGNSEAAYFLGKLFSEGDIRIRDYLKAQDWLQRAAQLGHERAIDIVLAGSTVVQSKEPECVCAESPWDKKSWLGHRLIAEKGSDEAQFCVADGFRDSDRAAAEKAWWYQAAAEQGHPEAIKKVTEMGVDGAEMVLKCVRPTNVE